MIWKRKRSDGWRRFFAVLPVTVQGQTVWLEWYWRRWWGDHYEVNWTDPRQPDRPSPMGEREIEVFDAAWSLVQASRGGGPLTTLKPLNQATDEAAAVLLRHLDARNPA